MAYLYEYMRRFLHIGCRFLGSYVVIPMTLFLLKIFKHSPHLVVLSGALVRRWRDWVKVRNHQSITIMVGSYRYRILI